MSAPINPNTGRPFAAGDTINARNRAAANDFSGWQQQQAINSWNKGTIANAAGRQPRVRPQAPPKPAGQPAAPAPTPPSGSSQPGPSPMASYTTGFKAEDQAINTGNVVGRMQAESQFKPQGVTGDGARAIEDHRRSQLANDTAQMRRGMQLQNSQQYMKDQIARSEIMQQGLANQSKIYNDLVQRDVSQIGLASQLQAAMLRSRMALAQALMGVGG
jgi:hypothetical protein